MHIVFYCCRLIDGRVYKTNKKKYMYIHIYTHMHIYIYIFKEMLLMGPRLFDVVFGMISDYLLAVSPHLAPIPTWSS